MKQINRQVRACAWGFALSLTALALSQGQILAAENRGSPAENQRKALAVLQSDAPSAEKALACKQLAVCGTAEAVPALAPLLSSAPLGAWARIALEAIPDPAADEALRTALGGLQGRLLVGAINSIGVRRDVKAVEPLIGKLKDPDAEVASAAAAALGRIGGSRATGVLEQSLATAPAGVRSAVAEGCILCAERLVATGKTDAAVKLFDKVRKTELPKQRVVEATRGAILARGSAGIPLLLEELRSADPAHFAIALRTARELPGADVTKALADELNRTAPERQARVLWALADRRDAAVLPAVEQAARAGSMDLRVAAVGVLGHSGTAASVPLLLEAAVAENRDLARAGKTALAGLPGNDIDPALTGRLEQAAGKQRQVLIEVAASRRIAAAVPAILPSLAATDPGLRGAAVDAIGELGGAKDATVLVELLQKSPDARDRSEIENALLAIGSRAGTACIPAFLPLARHAEPALRIIGLHALAAVGGGEALEGVKAALVDKDEGVQDEAVRTLSTWPNNWPDDTSVAEPLLALAKSDGKHSHQVLGFRGYLQYVQGAKNLKDDERLAKISEVLPMMKWPEAKPLAIAVIGTISHPAAVQQLTALAGDPATAEEACSALVMLAGKKTPGLSPEQRRKALQTVVDQTKNDATRKRAEEALKGVK